MAKARNQLERIWLLTAAILLFVVILGWRLYQLQIIHGQEYVLLAERQYYRTIPDVYNRGSIFFQAKDGQLVPAAVQKSGFILSVNPSIITDRGFVFESLAKVVNLEHSEFEEKLNRGGVNVILARRLEPAAAEAIRRSNLTGVFVSPEKWRFYPGGRLAAHSLGLVAYRENELAGRYGLERYYEDTLKRPENDDYVNFFVEVFTNIRRSVLENSRDKTGNLILTIEPQVQAVLEEELKKINERWDSGHTGGLIIEPATGEIRALAVYPGFDPNAFQAEKSPAIFSNPLVENVYEMGSIVKALTLSAGLDAGAITPATTYFDAGTAVFNNRTISNYDGRGRGLVDMQQVLNQSLNTGAAFVMSKIGRQRFADYLLAFGLGSESGIDLPNEARNLVSNLQSPRDLEYATASFGQGIALTPMTAARAFSTLANGGRLIQPHLVKIIDYQSGSARPVYYEPGNQVLKPETAEEVSRMLVQTVDQALVGGRFKIPNYSVAAKTGTAQIPKSDARGYYDDRFLHSFFGYFPAFDAKFLIFLFTYNPREGARFASETLTPSFMDLVKYLINYYEIPPDR